MQPKSLKDILPVLPVEDTVVFPHMVVPILLKTSRFLPVIEEATGKDKMLFVISGPSGEVEEKMVGSGPQVGTICRISKLSKEEEGTVLVVQGLSRGTVEEVVSKEPYTVRVQSIASPVDDGPRIRALRKNLMKQFTELVEVSPNLPVEILRLCKHVDDASTLADMIGAYSNLDRQKKQEILESVDLEKRLEKLTLFVNQELELAKMGHNIQTQVQEGIDRSQREYFLREQLKVIQKELGVDEQGPSEIQELRQRMEKKNLPEAAHKVADKEIGKLARMNPSSSEYTVSMNYLDLLLDLPWSEATKDSLEMKKAERVLNKHHYGLEKVKKRILEYLAVRKLNPAHKGPILCFYGPPGTGKTSLGRSIAEAMGRKFARISLGGVRDEAEIRGHRRTYVGSLPGRIIQGLKKTGSNNPVFMLDEIDKLGMDFRGDPSSALLEVLDPEQNYSFSDHYLDVEFDLSKIMFITTANQLDTIPRPLLDRMEVLELPGYTEFEKLRIARTFLVPRQVKEHGLSPRRVTFSDDAIRGMVREYTREAGVRNLEREIGAVCRGVARKVASNHHGAFEVGAGDLRGYLGLPKHAFEVAERTSVPGVATGMAWTPTGGDILFVEATSMPGQKSLVLTGQLGEVMKESAQAALSYLRSKAGTLGISEDFFSARDLHVHVPAGAIPKDGPSAGVTILSALASLLTCRPIKSDMAMTGEVTLRGAVLPVGGIKEKILAANRNGIRHVILPERNGMELEDLPQEVKGSITFHLVKKMEEVLDIALDAPVGPSCN
jgi:ATP-dependent Lon protease